MSPLGPRCFKCLMFSPSGPVELVFLVDLRAAEVCAIVIFMGVVGSDSIFLWKFSFFLSPALLPPKLSHVI